MHFEHQLASSIQVAQIKGPDPCTQDKKTAALFEIGTAVVQTDTER